MYVTCPLSELFWDAMPTRQGGFATSYHGVQSQEAGINFRSLLIFTFFVTDSSRRLFSYAL